MRCDCLGTLGGVLERLEGSLGTANDPFGEAPFLCALEPSGSVGSEAGWVPKHLVVGDAECAAGAMPLYLKDHSFGEYIFDWGWADAAMRLGIAYYPKLVAMVPFTPVTGSRMLVAPGVDRAEVVRSLVDGLRRTAEETDACSVHVLFCTEEEQRELVGTGLFAPRLSMQFHWVNEGYASFEDFLGRFRSALRKQVRRERRCVAEAGLEIRVLEGSELGDREWRALRRFYVDTCARKGAHPYLTAEFFVLLRERFAHRVVAALAYRGEEPVAGSLNFEKGQHLYGRYWGCDEQYEMLHFELCYYRLIERAIEKGLTRFEAGAQGTHKLRRGMMPAPIYSAHWIRHPVLAAAVYDYLPRETEAVQRQMRELASHGPFRRGE